MNKDKISKIIDEISKNFAELSNNCSDDIDAAAQLIIQSIQSGGKVMFCGNGGSAADSQHLAAELIGRYRKDRRALPGLALTTDTSNITAVANDYSYKEIFSRQIEGIGKENDVLYAISTSGKSENVIEAINVGLCSAFGTSIKKIPFSSKLDFILFMKPSKSTICSKT